MVRPFTVMGMDVAFMSPKSMIDLYFAQGWNGSSSGYMQDDGLGRYGRDSYDARYGMDRYGSGGLEQHHDEADDEADDDEVR